MQSLSAKLFNSFSGKSDLSICSFDFDINKTFKFPVGFLFKEQT